MIDILKSDKRGHANHGWLDSRFSFSFSDYYDPKRMGFRHLRVINEDWIAPAKGFGMHPHQDMEIITYLLSGQIEHKDSMGTGGIIRPGEIQKMSAGTGIHHSEFNPSSTEKTHLLQIWIFPNERGIKPNYEQIQLPRESLQNTLRLIGAPGKNAGAVEIHQDAKLYASLLQKDKTVSHTVGEGRHAWLQLARGSVSLNGAKLDEGDGAAISSESELEIVGQSPESEFLLFDLV